MTNTNINNKSDPPKTLLCVFKVTNEYHQAIEKCRKCSEDDKKRGLCQREDIKKSFLLARCDRVISQPCQKNKSRNKFLLPVVFLCRPSDHVNSQELYVDIFLVQADHPEKIEYQGRAELSFRKGASARTKSLSSSSTSTSSSSSSSSSSLSTMTIASVGYPSQPMGQMPPHGHLPHNPLNASRSNYIQQSQPTLAPNMNMNNNINNNINNLNNINQQATYTLVGSSPVMDNLNNSPSSPVVPISTLSSPPQDHLTSPTKDNINRSNHSGPVSPGKSNNHNNNNAAINPEMCASQLKNSSGPKQAHSQFPLSFSFTDENLQKLSSLNQLLTSNLTETNLNQLLQYGLGSNNGFNNILANDSSVGSMLPGHSDLAPNSIDWLDSMLLEPPPPYNNQPTHPNPAHPPPSSENRSSIPPPVDPFEEMMDAKLKDLTELLDVYKEKKRKRENEMDGMHQMMNNLSVELGKVTEENSSLRNYIKRVETENQDLRRKYFFIYLFTLFLSRNRKWTEMEQITPEVPHDQNLRV
eukprot:TRINITY_DN159_c0_g2_i1.p1 TRINITY_DN159_c0_g2~~TRINITY_DN159_c0_g2_i1.p1  ORF type:complete len:599 (-),score=137.50 TRINITY_DN159_c0_g2_i1:135-1712(-)